VYLLNLTGLTAGNLSSHTKKPIAAGDVEMERAFVGNRSQTTYSLSRGGGEAFDAYCENVEEILQMLPERKR
jgi:hypothetical protein